MLMLWGEIFFKKIISSTIFTGQVCNIGYSEKNYCVKHVSFSITSSLMFWTERIMSELLILKQ